MKLDLSYNEWDFIESLLTVKHEIEHGEWLYSKNENRLCSILENPEARTKLRALYDAVSDLVD